jgi:hypothetical protein
MKMQARTVLCVIGGLLVSMIVQSGELHVLPVVADNVAGRNDSLWDTEIRIFSLNPGEDLVVRRKWVCLEGGGFEDDPATAPVWRLSDEIYHFDYGDVLPIPLERRRIIFLDGASLLQGSGKNVGAVALEIEGSAIVFSRISNVRDEPFDPWSTWHSPFQLLGLGQLIRAEQAPLQGAAVFPWLTPDISVSFECTQQSPCNWRNNVGFVNPSSQPLNLTAEIRMFFAVPFIDEPDPECPIPGESGICPSIGGESDYHQGEDDFNLLEIGLPPWGWTQVNSIDYLFSKGVPWGGELFVNAASTLVLNIIPETDDRPYYAYLSQVFSGIHDRNDPAFMTPIPGRFRSIYDDPEKVGLVGGSAW